MCVQTEVEKLLYQKKYSSAIELIEYQKEATKDKEIQILLATAYMEQNKHQEALTVLLSVEETFDKDWKISRNIGTEYERLGNKPEALKYYQKSLAQLKDTDDVPVKEDEVFFTEQDIKRVGG